MRTLEKIFRHPLRWRRSHGFGVHSPFAYDFITKVLCEREAAYYAYAEIAAFCPKARRAGINEIFAGKDMSVPEAQMIFRILCYFNPAEIIEMGHGHEVTNIILERAVPKARRTVWHAGRAVRPAESGEPLILINQLTKDETAEAYGFISGLLSERDAVVIIRNLKMLPGVRTLWERLAGSGIHGMGFFDEYTAVFVGHKGLPHQIFPVVL